MTSANPEAAGKVEERQQQGKTTVGVSEDGVVMAGSCPTGKVITFARWLGRVH